MSYATFDCSQFLTFSSDESMFMNDVVQFERLAMKVLKQEGISGEKLIYLNPFLLDRVIELFNQEFVGVFEDWKEEGNPPIELINLKKGIIEFSSKLDIEFLKLMIISCASENIEEDAIVCKTVHIDQFYEGLFVLSKWNFKEVADNLILTINL